MLCNFAGLLVCFFTIFSTFDTVANKKIEQILDVNNFKNAILLSKAFNKVTYSSYFGPSDKSKIQIINRIYIDPTNKYDYNLLIDDSYCFNEYMSKKYTDRCLLTYDGNKKNHFKSTLKTVFIVFCSVAMFVSVFSLYGDVVLFSSALVSLLSLDVFFSFIYWGGYRHQALWLVFMTTLLWISRKEKRSFCGRSFKLRNLGYKAFIILMLLQVWPAVSNAYEEIFSTPSSNSKDFSQLLKEDKRIKGAAIISNNDLLLEAFHYYADNPTYIMSERKFDLVFPFAKNVMSSYTLDDILNSANYVAVCNHVPVLILMSHSFKSEYRVLPENIVKPTLFQYEYLRFYIDPQQFKRFQMQTSKIATFPETRTENGFDVYLLRSQDAHIQGNCSSQYIFDRNMFDLEKGHR